MAIVALPPEMEAWGDASYASMSSASDSPSMDFMPLSPPLPPSLAPWPVAQPQGEQGSDAGNAMLAWAPPEQGPSVTAKPGRPLRADRLESTRSTSSTLLSEQLENSVPGVRRAAALALGRLGEAAVRRDMEEEVLQHAGRLCELHMDPSASVREAAISAMAKVQVAAEQHKGRQIAMLLSEHLHQHWAASEFTAFYRAKAESSAASDSQAEGPHAASMPPLKRAASEGAFSRRLVLPSTDTGPSSCSLLRQRAVQTSSKRRWARPSYQEIVELEMKEVLATLGKSSGSLDLVKHQAKQLAENLDDSDPKARSSAALSLGRLGADAVLHIGMLSRLLDDGDSFVRAAASVALSQISGTAKSSVRTTLTGPAKGRSGSSGGAQGRPASAGSSRRARPASASSTGRACPASASSSGPARPASASKSGRLRPASAGSASQARPLSAANSRKPSGTALPGSRSRSNRPFRTGLAHSSPFRDYTGISYTVKCHCGLPVQRRESLRCRQKGCFYFGCPHEQGGCNFKVWAND